MTIEMRYVKIIEANDGMVEIQYWQDNRMLVCEYDSNFSCQGERILNWILRGTLRSKAGDVLFRK